MKQVSYEIKDLKGTLKLTVPSITPEDRVIYECDCAYLAWKDTDKADDNFLDFPEYIARCISDTGIEVIVFEFEESE